MFWNGLLCSWVVFFAAFSFWVMVDFIFYLCSAKRIQKKNSCSAPLNPSFLWRLFHSSQKIACHFGPKNENGSFWGVCMLLMWTAPENGMNILFHHISPHDINKEPYVRIEVCYKCHRLWRSLQSKLWQMIRFFQNVVQQITYTKTANLQQKSARIVVGHILVHSRTLWSHRKKQNPTREKPTVI